MYPLVCLCGAVTVDSTQKLIFAILLPYRKRIWRTRNDSKPLHYLHDTNAIFVGVVAICALLGLSRIYSLYNGIPPNFNYLVSYFINRPLIWLSFESVMNFSSIVQGYHAPLEITMEVGGLDSTYYPKHGKINVCFGKEWHRFPTSFFLPSDKCVLYETWKRILNLTQYSIIIIRLAH